MKSSASSGGGAAPPAAPKSSPSLTPAQHEFARVLGDVLAAAWDAEPRHPLPATASDEQPPAKKLSRRAKKA
jgi:hypothetical protein